MHLSESPGPPNEIRLLFSTVMKIMENLKVQYYEEALIKNDLNVTWMNIESQLRQTNGSYGYSKENDSYHRETFQRLLRNLHVRDKQKLLLFLDDVLLQVPETNLLRPHAEELRTRLNALSFNNQTIDQMRIFTHQWRETEQSRGGREPTTQHIAPHQTNYYIRGNYFEENRLMVDVFRDINNSTIINKSLVESSFNKVKREHDEETARR